MTLVFACLLFIPSLVFAVDFDILSYQGDLNIHADNTAIFKETITYRFGDDYNGQLVGLGKAGKMPEGFDIDPDPTVQVSKNGQIIQNVSFYTMEEEDGYKVKIYNAGYAGDTVRVTVTWQLSNLLFLYKDIAELNWQPLTDSSEPIENFEFRVTGFNGAEKLFFHTGKLFTEGKVEKTGGDYRVHLKNLPRQRGVELHAYWLRKDFETALDQGLKGNRLAEFEKIEESITAEKAQSKALVTWIIPFLLSLFLVFSVIFYCIYRRKTSPSKKYAKNHRLYEPPMDLEPMVLSEAVYSTSLEEVSPLTKGGGKFTFDQLVQATLLDVIDRGNVSIISNGDEVRLKVVKEKGLASFEKDCLNLAFSGREEVLVSDLFADYQVSTSLYQGAKAADEKRIQKTGRKLKSSFEQALKQMQDGVRKRVSSLQLPDYYRSLSNGEKILRLTIGVFTILPAFVGFGWFLYSLDAHGYLSLPLPILGFVGLMLAAVYYWTTRFDTRDGVLNEDGLEAYYLWTSFENMLRDIAHLDKAVLESIVVWNRLLVYATLFGYADKVSHLMRSYQIQVENPDINLYVAYGWHSMFYHSTAQMSHYASIANTASNYSVSSGSGSSGGGFSGGGGGGSIGAF
ncbi:Conserved domain protein [Streptococcus oralis subsp. tigurinus]|uniref:Conserved domain protein n=1 Tax=Streptococcus oralis subsp. tigurinus TaxID=1077464 RepID=A0A223ZTD6_STROR|nr:Conserved domain protein [Streptococcus oralis subsp. tigurinus]